MGLHPAQPTLRPVLVVGNQFDPATRYEGAVTVHDLLPNSSLLTLHAWGHTSLFLSGCATFNAHAATCSLGLHACPQARVREAGHRAVHAAADIRRGRVGVRD